MKLRPMAVLVVAIGVLAMWFAFGLGGGESSIHSAQPAEPTSGVKASQTDPELQQVARAKDEGLGQPVRVAIVEKDPPVADERPALGKGSKDSVLVVIALDRATGDPVPNVRVMLWADPRDHGTSNSYVHGSVGEFGNAPVTDSAGRAEFRLPPGIASTLDASGEDDHVGRVDDIPIPALGLGEYREVAIQLQVGYDLRFIGRVVEADGGAPVSSARVRIQSSSWTRTEGERSKDEFETHSETSTDFDGLFEVLLPSWAARAGRVDAPGYGPVLFGPVAGHETPGMALQIEIAKSGRLIGTLSVTDGASPQEFSVQVKASGYDLLSNSNSVWFLGDLSLTASVRADGSWEIDDLPAGAPLEIELLDRGETLRRHHRDLVLEPGEERVLAWRLGAGTTIRGKAVVAGSGEPYGRQTIWLVLEGGSRGPGLFQTYWEPTAQIRTDRDGHFVFADVGPGRWLVGPAPEHEPDDRSAAPLVEVVEVLAGGQDVEIVVEVHCGLYIRGTVTDPEGGPVEQSFVSGDHSNTLIFTGDNCDDQGRFSLGPLIPGEYTLEGMSSGYARSDPVVVRAGAEGVMLRLNHGGALSGVVVLAGSTERQRAEVAIFCERKPGFKWWFDSDDEGLFEVEGLTPGSYSIKASTGRLVGLVTSVQVSAGAMVDDIVVALRPGASLHISYDGQSEWIAFQIFMDGAEIESDHVERGDPKVLVLPAGEATVRFIDWSEREKPVTLGERTVTLIVGETAQVVWPNPKDKK